ncbi:MAG: hypothetical protein CM15mP28_3830 [Pseudomonadota bacterium]|nr:MAG: hypothetical protein CM15mP28_3830 [Pseudomonadota bacterium]
MTFRILFLEYPKFTECAFCKGSITNDVDLKRVFHEKPDYIFHLAAFFANQNSVDYPERDLLVSQLGTVKMLEHAVLQGGIQRFVYAGSGCAIYGAQAPLPLKEEFISMHLSTPYQISKWLVSSIVIFTGTIMVCRLSKPVSSIPTGLGRSLGNTQCHSQFHLLGHERAASSNYR